MDLVNILSSLAGNDTVNEISKKFNIDTNKVSSVITTAMPTIIGAMQKNASTESGAAALAKALGDHANNSGSMISNLAGVDLTDGSKILGKILGNNAGSIFDKIGKQTGTTSGQVKVDERLAAEIAGKAVHGWHATAYSDGKKRVYVTFEEVKTVGA